MELNAHVLALSFGRLCVGAHAQQTLELPVLPIQLILSAKFDQNRSGILSGCKNTKA